MKKVLSVIMVIIAVSTLLLSKTMSVEAKAATNYSASKLGTIAGSSTVRRGSRGETVRKLQGILNELSRIAVIPEKSGFYCGAEDGIFGANTEKAVRNYQKWAGLSVDGIVGPRTWKALENSLSGWLD